jgi:ribonuclease D
VTSPETPRPAPALIERPDALASLAQRLQGKSRVALDTEAASFHRYVDRVYLVQLSSDEETALVDPLAVGDLGPVGALLADPSVEKIFHDADYDLRILDRDFGFRGRRLWDTRIAAQLAGETAFGLGSILEKYFGIRLSKKLQRADWSQRPLTQEMIDYAAADTAHLPELRDLLERRLRDLSRLAWAEEEFLRLEEVRWSGPVDGEGHLQMKGARTLRPRERAVLRALWEWRERAAEALDRAPFRVVGHEVLVALARAAPRTPAALAAAPLMPPTVARRYGAELLEAVAAGLAVPEQDLPRLERRPRQRPDPEAEARFQRLRALRARRAPEVGLDPGLIFPNWAMQEIARTAPKTAQELDTITDIRRWQRAIIGDRDILEAVGRRDASTPSGP